MSKKELNMDWEDYETKEQTFLKEKDYEALGKYHFLGKIFSIQSNLNLLKNEIQNNNIEINGIEFVESSRRCKKCGSKNIQTSVFQNRSADEGTAMRYKCMKCNDVIIEY